MSDRGFPADHDRVGLLENRVGDIRNFGAKSIDEVKFKLAELGLALKDSPPGFDPSTIVREFADDDFIDAEPETEQY